MTANLGGCQGPSGDLINFGFTFTLANETPTEKRALRRQNKSEAVKRKKVRQSRLSFDPRI